MKNIKLLPAVFILFCSCSKDIAPEKAHLGKWKLMEIAFPLGIDSRPPGSYSFMFPTLDFSKGNVIFEFKRNGVLTISEDMMSYVDPEHGIFESDAFCKMRMGTYTYSISISLPPSWPTTTLEIGDFPFIDVRIHGSSMAWRFPSVGSFNFVKVKK